MIEVIPAINETSFEEVKKKIQTAQDFGAEWVHIDVADGTFTKNVLWNNFVELKDFTEQTSVKIEVHLMIENPDSVIGDWLAVGVKKIIVHVEAARNMYAIHKQCKAAGAELCIAANPDTPIEKLLEYQDLNHFLILSVHPGLSGQVFITEQLEKIRSLRVHASDAKIEVDGGVNLENAPHIKAAGADILVSASYIWNHQSPAAAYQSLK